MLLCFCPMGSTHLPKSYLLKPLVISELCPGSISTCKNLKRAITLKKARFLFSALLLNEIYLPTKCLFIPLVVTEFCSGQKNSDGRTYIRTDRRTYIHTYGLTTDGESDDYNYALLSISIFFFISCFIVYLSGRSHSLP